MAASQLFWNWGREAQWHENVLSSKHSLCNVYCLYCQGIYSCQIIVKNLYYSDFEAIRYLKSGILCHFCYSVGCSPAIIYGWQLVFYGLVLKWLIILMRSWQDTVMYLHYPTIYTGQFTLADCVNIHLTPVYWLLYWICAVGSYYLLQIKNTQCDVSHSMVIYCKCLSGSGKTVISMLPASFWQRPRCGIVT